MLSLQALRIQAIHDAHIVDARQQVPVVVDYRQIRRGRSGWNFVHALYVDACITRELLQHLAVLIVANSRDQSAIDVEPSQVFRNIASNATGRHLYASWIRVI